MRKIILALSLVFPLVSQASTAFNIQEIACTGELSSSGQSLLCGGDLSLNGGNIYSDHSIAIKAGGNIFLANLDIHVFSLSLTGGNVIFGDDVRIDARYISAIGLDNAQGNIDTSPGIYIYVGERTPVDWGGAPGGIGLSPGANIVVGGMPPVFWGGGAIPLPVPEPTTYSAMLVGLVALGWAVRRKKNILENPKQ